jgi:ankyrin repeat protein
VLMQPIRGAGPDPAGNAGYFRCLELLLQYGVDPNVRRMGQTALHFTAGRGGLAGVDRARFAALLLDRGANPSLRDDLLQSTALGWACRWGRKEMVELLLSRGVPAHEMDAQPWASPAAWARKMGHHDIEQLLSQHVSGAEPADQSSP